MNRSEVQCFLAAAETLSFTKAADKLYLSRQAVSRRILNLEEKLNTRLFFRNNQALILTDEGLLYYDFFLSTQARWEKLQTSLRSRADTAIVVSFLEGLDLPQELLHSLFAAGDQYHVPIRLGAYDMHDLPALVENGEQDLILTYGGPRLDMFRGYEYVPIGTYGMVLAAHKSLLHGKTPLTAADFEPFTMVTWMRRDQTAENAIEKCTQCCLDFGFHCQDIHVVSNRDTARAEIEAGHGVGICTEIDRLAYSPVIRTFPLTGSSTLVCMWKKDRISPAAKAVVRNLRCLARA